MSNNNFRVFPYENRYLVPFEAAVRVLNPVVAVKIRSAAIHAALATVCVPALHCVFGLSRSRLSLLRTCRRGSRV